MHAYVRTDFIGVQVHAGNPCVSQQQLGEGNGAIIGDAIGREAKPGNCGGFINS